MSQIDVRVLDTDPRDSDADALVLGIFQEADSTHPWEPLDEASGGLVAEALSGTGFRGEPGKTWPVPCRGALPCGELVLVGLGKRGEADLETWRSAVAAATTTARDRGAARIAVPITDGPLGEPSELAAAATEAVKLATYEYTEYKESSSSTPGIGELRLLGDGDGLAEAARRAAVVADAACWARDLINTAPNDKRPPALADRAAAMGQERGLDVEVIDEGRARELGMRALLAVGQGSDAPPRVVVLEHDPGDRDAPAVALVGKGITFDTGGISIKRSSKMHEMKADMSGAAAVLGAMRAVAELELPIRVVGVVPMAENMPSGRAYRPGDVVRALNGKTVEIINTDAEGRLILADALSYAADRFSPACMVDLATLTGACVVALGQDVAGLMGNDDDLLAELESAGDATGERLWRLPLFADYRELLDSPVADVKNSGGRHAGAITAGKFLQEFVNDATWAHLDIAGPAFTTKGGPYRPKGGVGFGVRLLSRWLADRAGRTS